MKLRKIKLLNWLTLFLKMGKRYLISI